VLFSRAVFLACSALSAAGRWTELDPAEFLEYWQRTAKDEPDDEAIPDRNWKAEERFDRDRAFSRGDFIAELG
jgi:hypothetical protein